MALRNNKQMSIAKAKQEIAANTRKSARTQYLPKVDALGGYMWTSKEISILDDEKKTALSNLGTNTAAGLQNSLSALSALGITLDLTPLASVLNQTGIGLVDALRTDTRNMFAGAVMVTQPVFMGGAIVALNKMADINEDLAANSLDMQRQNTLYNIDQAYWQVVSLRHKQKLAESYLQVVQKLDGDVQKMIDEGVATRSDGLNVKVKVNEAEMTLTKVNDGVVLSKMLLCQLCGLPVDSQIILADEEKDNLTETAATPQIDMGLVATNRPELRMLQNSIDLSKQQTNILKAGNLPTLALTGGYAVTNPNTLNGFQKRFAGLWNVGVMVRIPIWNWGDVKYKVRAAKGSTTMARLEMEEVQEKIELQVKQSSFKVNEASKRLAMAQANIAHAEENLRTANLGFAEGVITTTTVLEAQTAWLKAQSEKIDAEIDLKLSQVELQKALGTLE
jgi:outer membrane protein TolC